MVLKTKVILNENVKLANLPANDEVCPSGRELTVSGWGDEIDYGYKSRTMDNNYPSANHRYLWAVKQECFDVSDCDRYIGNKDAVLCVGDSENLRNSACHRDSGGNAFLYFTEQLNLTLLIYKITIVLLQNRFLTNLA